MIIGNTFAVLQLTWGTPLYLLALYGALRFALRDPQSENGLKVRWSPLESVSVTLFMYFAGQLLGGLILYASLSVAGWHEQRITTWLSDNTVGQFLLISIIEAITIYALSRFLKRRNASLQTIGLTKKPKLSDAGRAIGGYVVYFGVYLLVIWFVKTIVPNLDLEQRQEIGFEQVARTQLPLVFMSLVVLPPITEELLMRGFLYTGLRAKLPKIVAVFITSFLFAIAHLQAGSSTPLLWVAAIDTFVLSVVLIHLKEKTGTLWAPIFLHALKNGIAFIALFVLVK